MRDNRIEVVEVVKGDINSNITIEGSLFKDIKSGENISENGLFRVVKESGEPTKIYYIGEGKNVMVNAIKILWTN